MPKYTGNPYWETEKPLVVSSTKNVIRYYPNAGKLQVSTPDWTDNEGNQRHGKTVTLDVIALREIDELDKAEEIFRGILEDIEFAKLGRPQK